jgi:hypothetical protein
VQPEALEQGPVGIAMREAAIVRTNSNGSIASRPYSGVPSTWTRLLIGTDSGYGSRLASCAINPARWARDSPMPTIPPQQTRTPAARTRSSVSSRSRYSRVVTISP